MRKCPNCAGEMMPNPKAGIMLCPYCDTEISILDIVKEREAGGMSKKTGKIVVPSLFVVQSADFNKGGQISWRALCEVMNSGKSSGQLKKELIESAKGRNDFVSPDWNPELRQRLFQKISHLLLENEEFLIYKDSGVFSRLKGGIAITNQKIIFVKKRKNKTLEYSQMRRIDKASIGDSWYFNGDLDYDIDVLGCTNVELGKMLAYICMRCAEISPPDHRVAVGIR